MLLSPEAQTYFAAQRTSILNELLTCVQQQAQSAERDAHIAELQQGIADVNAYAAAVDVDPLMANAIHEAATA